MAVQLATPGVYIEEFAPGAPIEGVGTNTAAFIGTALRGPIKTPTLVQSWDDFATLFGDFLPYTPAGFLAPSVFGFFLNGGTACYIVRASTGEMAKVDLAGRADGDPVLVVRARQEGAPGNALSVKVEESSLLADLLAALPLPAPKPKTLKAWRASAKVQAVSNERIELTVDDNKGFDPGDRVLVEKGGDSTPGIVASTGGTTKLTLLAPLQGNVDFAGGTVRSADLALQQRSFRVAVPDGLSLSRALPRGTALSVRQGAEGEVREVESAGGDTVTLTQGLANAYSLKDAGNLPEFATLEFDLTVTDGASAPAAEQTITTDIAEMTVSTSPTPTQHIEVFRHLAMSFEHPAHWSKVASTLVTLQAPEVPPDPVPDDARPAVQSYPLVGGAADDRAGAAAKVTASPDEFLALLKPYDDVALVCAPGFVDKAVQQALIAHCESMHDRFAILDSQLGAQPGSTLRDQLADVRSTLGFAALYYPWIQVRNPKTGKDFLCPPSGHLAGVYARTDAERGVHKAPANANIRGALGLERLLTDDEQGPLNLLGINALRVFRGQAQPMVWGARTTATDRNWQYVNIRRLFLFLEESIQEGIHWAVFEPNNLQLWQKLKRTISEFLTRVWRDGALFGATADKAFYVRIDEVLNPPSTRKLGRLYIEIGVQPTYPAEFIVVRIGIWDGGAEVNEA
jgi:phage tail sheath protein FI